MRKPALNFVVDSIAFFLFLCLLSTGFLIFFVIPPASALAVWGMGRHAWGEIHFWFAISFLIMLAIHVYLHWSWIRKKIQGSSNNLQYRKKRRIYAILLFIVVMLLLLAPFLSPVSKSDGEQQRHNIHVQVNATYHV